MGITVNKLTDEFVIHGIESEYDYYYISHSRNEIISTLSSAFYEIKGQKFKFSLINEKSIKNYVTNKKDKKQNPSFTRMSSEHLVDVDDFLSQNISAQGELNHNGVVGPKVSSNTVFSSHKNVKEV